VTGSLGPARPRGRITTPPPRPKTPICLTTICRLRPDVRGRAPDRESAAPPPALEVEHQGSNGCPCPGRQPNSLSSSSFLFGQVRQPPFRRRRTQDQHQGPWRRRRDKPPVPMPADAAGDSGNDGATVNDGKTGASRTRSKNGTDHGTSRPPWGLPRSCKPQSRTTTLRAVAPSRLRPADAASQFVRSRDFYASRSAATAKNQIVLGVSSAAGRAPVAKMISPHHSRHAGPGPAFGRASG